MVHRSERAGELPGSGDPDLDADAVRGVTLPAGRRIVPDPGYGDGTPTEAVGWVTEHRVPEIDRLWSELAGVFHATGLWPLVMESLRGQDARPWLDGELDPRSSSPPDDHDAERVLEGWWSHAAPLEEEEDAAFQPLAPFGRRFPGMADAVEGSGGHGAPEEVVAHLDGRLGLVPVTRPADVVSTLGWMGPVNHFADMGKLAAVLRTWEDRFGAHVVGIGFATLTLSVAAPPSTPDEALAVAAEHFAACPDNVYQGAGSIDAYASLIRGRRRWDFWWD